MFNAPPEDEAREVAKIFGLLKVHTPRGILLDGLTGKELFAGRRYLEEELASGLVDLNSYMKRARWSRPRRATPWNNVATPSIPTHAFIFSALATCT